MFFLKDALASQVAKTSVVFQTNASRHVCESKALPERQECSWGNLEIVQKPVFFFVGVFFDCFKRFPKIHPCQDLIVWLSVCFFAAKTMGNHCGFVCDAISFQFREITIWPAPWRGFCGYQDIDPGGVFAEGQRAEEGWKCLEDGRNGVLNWYCLNWYELIWIDTNCASSTWIPPTKKQSPFF